MEKKVYLCHYWSSDGYSTSSINGLYIYPNIEEAIREVKDAGYTEETDSLNDGTKTIIKTFEVPNREYGEDALVAEIHELTVADRYPGDSIMKNSVKLRR